MDEPPWPSVAVLRRAAVDAGRSDFEESRGRVQLQFGQDEILGPVKVGARVAIIGVGSAETRSSAEAGAISKTNVDANARRSISRSA